MDGSAVLTSFGSVAGGNPLVERLLQVSAELAVLGLAAAIELGRTLGRLPPRTVVYAIEAESFEAGAPLSQPVAAATVIVADRIRSEIEEAAP